MPGKLGALLRSHHVHDALLAVEEWEVSCRAELPDVGVERDDLFLRYRIGDAVIAALPVGGRRVVVRSGDDRTDAPGPAAGQPQSFVGLRTRHLVHQMAIDVQHRGPVVLDVDDVVIPQFVVQCARHL
jgi:hypothetical protein